MDRSYVERLLANARTREVTTLDLPVCGETLRMFTSLTTDEQLRVATAGGDDEDAAARQAVGVLRFVLVDETGQLLLRSFAEAGQLLNALDTDDAAAVIGKLMEIAADQTAEDTVEVGKAS